MAPSCRTSSGTLAGEDTILIITAGRAPRADAGQTTRGDVTRMNTIVLAYSGGFASSNAVHWLTETYGADVVTVTLDVGSGR